MEDAEPPPDDSSVKTGIEEVPSEKVGMLDTGFKGIPEAAAFGIGVVEGIEEDVFDGFKVAGAV